MLVSKRTYKWFYDNIQSNYYNLLIKWCFLPFGGEEKCREELLSPVEFSPKDKILDMCCGTGGATFTIARKAGEGAEITGMDLSSGQIGVAKKNNRFSNVIFIEGDVTDTGFESETFDKVFITHAIHEMVRETRLAALAEAKNLLKQGGKVIVLELDNPESLWVRLFAWFWLFYWLPFNFETPTRRDMFKHGLVNEVAEAGFKNIEKTNKYRGILQTVVGEK